MFQKEDERPVRRKTNVCLEVGSEDIGVLEGSKDQSKLGLMAVENKTVEYERKMDPEVLGLNEKSTEG